MEFCLCLVDFWYTTELILLMSLHIVIQFYFIYIKFTLTVMTDFFFPFLEVELRSLWMLSRQSILHHILSPGLAETVSLWRHGCLELLCSLWWLYSLPALDSWVVSYKHCNLVPTFYLVWLCWLYVSLLFQNKKIIKMSSVLPLLIIYPVPLGVWTSFPWA